MGPMSQALRQLAQRPMVLFAVALVQTMLGYLLTVSSTAALGPLMDRRPAAAAALAGDDGLLLELLQRHQELGAAWATTALVTLVVAVLLGWALAGTLLSALAFERVRGAAQLARATVESLWPLTTVSLLGLLLRAIPIGTTLLVWSWLRPELQGTFSSVLTATLGCAAALAIPWAMVTVTIDYARAAVLTDERARALPALKRALKLAWRRRSQTFTLALANAGLFLLALVIGQGLMALTAPWVLAHLVATLIAATLRVAVTAFGLTVAATIVTEDTEPETRSRS